MGGRRGQTDTIALTRLTSRCAHENFPLGCEQWFLTDCPFSLLKSLTHIPCTCPAYVTLHSPPPPPPPPPPQQHSFLTPLPPSFPSQIPFPQFPRLFEGEQKCVCLSLLLPPLLATPAPPQHPSSRAPLLVKFERTLERSISAHSETDGHDCSKTCTTSKQAGAGDCNFPLRAIRVGKMRQGLNRRYRW